MEIMSEQLDKEEAGLTTDRGLEGCVAGLQAFELFITSTFRKKYDKASQHCSSQTTPLRKLHLETTVRELSVAWHVSCDRSFFCASELSRQPEADYVVSAPPPPHLYPKYSCGTLALNVCRSDRHTDGL